MKAFIGAALPWVIMGIALAVVASTWAGRRGEKRADRDGAQQTPRREDNAATGMCIGMCLGAALGASGVVELSLGISLGMLLGLTLGSCIEKKA